LDFALNFHNIQEQEYVIAVRGLEIRVNESFISTVSSLPMGLPWDKEERARKDTQMRGHKNIKIGSKEKSSLTLCQKWPITLSNMSLVRGMMSVVYAYHFRLIHQLRHCYNQEPTNNLSLPYFLLLSLKEMSTKVKKGKHEFLAYHGLINFMVLDVLRI
jgi:hypothetical protein